MEEKQVKVIDGTNLIIGRLASQVAKMALLGQDIAIINCEKVVASGSKETLLSKFNRKGGIGRPFHGPFTPRMPDKIVRRAIRGMLPFHKSRGREAHSRVKCYIGLPEDFKNQEAETFESALADTKLKSGKSMTIGRIASLLGKYKGTK